MTNDITKQSSTLAVTSNQFVEKLKKYATATEIEFDDYQRQCVVNMFRAVEPMLSSQSMTWNDLDVNNLFNEAQKVAFLKLNASAGEIGFILRNQKRGNNWIKVLESQIMSNGNDTILKNFGRDVKDVKSYEVYEGDDFTGMQTDGWDVILPKHTPKYKSRKVVYSVYLIKKSNNEIEVSISEREDAKISLLANARNNGADEKLLRELDKYSIDELLTDEKWLDYKIKKGNGNDSPLFSPSYTSVASREKMIARKLRNHAIRRYPKDFGRSEVVELYEQTYEDERYVKTAVIDHEEVMELDNKTFEQEANKQELNPSTKETKPITKKQPQGETLKVIEEEPIQEEIIEEDVFNASDEVLAPGDVVEIVEQIVEPKTVKKTETPKQTSLTDDESWM